ncbi:MAG: DUF4912 domain-containing protein [Treponema sp.]|jgi:hypothetical protein|nr:DUF4912 domain-containing protein [Treponema sp.]
MEDIPLTRAYLESLATGDLIKLADDLGIDLPDNSDRGLIIEELLETASHDDGSSSHEPGSVSAEIPNQRSANQAQEITDSVIVESAPLPRHYNISYIEVMIRDPFWAFVFWEIKASDIEQLEKAQDFNGYFLKVSSLEKANTPPQTDGIFTVPVKAEDTAWYLGLSSIEGEERAEQCQYKVELCASLGGVETVLVVSNPIKLPGQPVFPVDASRNAGENQLARLSGFGDFHIPRRNERPLRTKKSRVESESRDSKVPVKQ